MDHSRLQVKENCLGYVALVTEQNSLHTTLLVKVVELLTNGSA